MGLKLLQEIFMLVKVIKKMIKLDDKDMRNLLLKKVGNYKDIKVFEEQTTPSGAARADVVIVSGHISGYEIKSDFDTLNRLNNQIAEYEKTFEKNIIVVGEKYAYNILEYIPEHWGVMVARCKKKPTLTYMRTPVLNPNVEFKRILGLLSSEELKKIVISTNLNGVLNFTKTEIRLMFKQKLIDSLEKNMNKKEKKQLKMLVRNQLKERP